MTRTVLKNDVKHLRISSRSQSLLPLSASPSLSISWLMHRITESLLSIYKQFSVMSSQSILRMLRIIWPLSIKTLSLIFELLLTHLLILSQLVSLFRPLSSRKILDETCIIMIKAVKVTQVINWMTVIETIEALNLKKTEIVSMTVFILTFLVKLNISLHISFLIVKPHFLLQNAQFRTSSQTLFLFIQLIKICHLISINSKLLI